jgi:hypothetical protein
VVAVDPGLLCHDVLLMPNVIHIKSTIQANEAQNELSKYARPANPISVTGEDVSYHESVNTRPFLRVLVCDINADAKCAAELLSASVLPHMTESCRCHCSTTSSSSSLSTSASSCEECSCGGILVLTLKLSKRPKEAQINRAVCAAKTALEALACWDFRVIHLGANSINERCVLNILVHESYSILWLFTFLIPINRLLALKLCFCILY